MNDGPANNSMELRDTYSELESGKGNGGHKSTGRKLEEILKDHEEPGNRWNCIFTISCSIAILIDPLYCYAPVIHTSDTGYCWKPDQALMWTYVALRLAVDVFYAIDFFGWWLGIRNKKTLGAFWTRSSQRKVVGSKGLKKVPLSVPYLILVSFPLPEGLLLSSYCSGLLLYEWDPTDALIICTPFQYSLRIYHIYGTLRLRRRPLFKTELGKWLKAVMDYLPFILASHLFGALWYRLAVQRLVNCWKPNWDSFLEQSEGKSKRSRDFICGKNSFKTENLSEWHRLCPVQEANPKVFDFGIYLYALQNNLTTSTNVVRRMPQSFWWALRHLSSFGSNLETSLYAEEIFLSVLISISGMALFLVYLNARVQESKKKLDEYKSKRKTELLKPDIDLWLHKNGIKGANLKTAIMKNIHKLGENKDINLQNILSVLPVNDKRSIIWLICLASLKKVPVLANIHKRVLVAICEHLKPVTYTEDSYIVQEGRPLGKMLFIVEGLAWTYTTNNIIDVGTLNKGDFYGEEVLTWAFGSPPFSGSPISTKTVVSQGKIEAFAIRTGDLKSVVYKFWWHFRENEDLSQLELWKHLAASSIQAAWRLHKTKAKLSNKWGLIPCP